MCLKLNEKYQLIDMSKKAHLVKQIIQYLFKCGKTRVCTILLRIKIKLKYNGEKLNLAFNLFLKLWKLRDLVLRKYYFIGNGKLERAIKENDNEIINKKIWDWFVPVRAKKIPVSGPMLQEKAYEVALRNGNHTFKA